MPICCRNKVTFATPTVFIQDGYRVSFYSYDLAERIHIHVFKAGHECKIWLDDLAMAFNRGFKPHEVAEIRQNAARKLLNAGLNMDAMRTRILS